jgi:hypothetical protein
MEHGVPHYKRIYKMTSYNQIVEQGVEQYQNRCFDLIKKLNHQGSEMFLDMGFRMSCVDFYESISDAIGFEELVEAVQRAASAERNQATELVAQFLASCLGLMPPPAEWVELGFDRACDHLPADDLYERYLAALNLVQGIADQVVVEASDDYRSALETHVAFLVDGGIVASSSDRTV